MRILLTKDRIIPFISSVFLFIIIQTIVYILEYIVGSNARLAMSSYSIQSLVLIGYIYLTSLCVDVPNSKHHFFTLKLYTFLILLISSLLIDFHYLFGYAFVLMGLSQIMELPDCKVKKRVLFDCSFFIAVSTLYSFQYILFMVIPFVAILLSCGRDIYNWLVPVASFVIFFILIIGWSMFKNIELSSLINYKDPILDFSTLIDSYQYVVIAFLGILTLINIYISRTLKFGKIGFYIWINIFTLIVSTLVCINSSGGLQQFIIIMAFPLAVSTNYMFNYFFPVATKKYLVTLIIVFTLAFRILKIIPL